jgi:glycosyltransferase involved in cell wall biosynthesis
MSYGKPVVVSNIPGPNEVVKDDYNGFLVKPRSPQAIADAIEKLAKDPMLFKKLSKNALRTAEKHSWKKVGDRYIEVYTQALR